jgi:uncharacterized RDD family membrane protein YckC
MSGPAPGVSYGSRFGRLIAYILDGLVMGVVLGIPYSIAMGLLVGASGSSDSAALIGMVIMIVVLAAFLLWKPWFWSHGGQTPAYKLLGLRVVRAADGGPVGMGQGIGRMLGYFVSNIVFSLGFVWILFDSKRQGWHDKLAGTVVISA